MMSFPPKSMALRGSRFASSKTEHKPALRKLTNGQADRLRSDLAVLFQGPVMCDRLDAALNRERRNTVTVMRSFLEGVADTMDRSESRPGARFADMLRETWREAHDAILGPEPVDD